MKVEFIIKENNVHVDTRSIEWKLPIPRKGETLLFKNNSETCIVSSIFWNQLDESDFSIYITVHKLIDPK